MSPLRALLLDRDGTIIEDLHYLCDPDQARLIPGAGKALGKLCRLGVRLFMVSNQSGIGRGYFSEQACLSVNARVEELLAAHGARLEACLYCPHAPGDKCACRKPGTGLWDELVRRFGLSPSDTAMVGDKAADVSFGRAAGLARVVLTLTGYGLEHARTLGLPTPSSGWLEIANPGPDQPHAVAEDLAAAAKYLAALELACPSCKPGQKA